MEEWKIEKKRSLNNIKRKKGSCAASESEKPVRRQITHRQQRRGKEEMAKKKKAAGILALTALIAAGVFIQKYHYYFTGTSSAPVRAKHNRDFDIPDIRSSVDKDQDGIDDQTDILQGARDYIATKPVYKSKYYSTGYPDDGYGVCTDVVANAMRSAGYDLMELVYSDIIANPWAYDIAQPDKHIDFRRVKNLKVYFARTAVSLTTDIYDISQWQGGDIVIFEDHIGIVSDSRNDRGVAYVIHHNGPYQASYEEDILEQRNDLVGHYRITI